MLLAIKGISQSERSALIMLIILSMRGARDVNGHGRVLLWLGPETLLNRLRTRVRSQALSAVFPATNSNTRPAASNGAQGQAARVGVEVGSY